jgi:hypothetical protein
VTPGYQAADQRHRFAIDASTATPWGIRFGGSLHWEAGVPFSRLASGLAYRGVPGDSAPIPRFFYPSGRRNDARNDSIWTLDAKIAREFNMGRHLHLQLSLEMLNVFDDDTYLVFNEARGNGVRIDGVDEAMRRTGRRVQIGIRLSF